MPDSRDAPDHAGSTLVTRRGRSRRPLVVERISFSLRQSRATDIFSFAVTALTAIGYGFASTVDDHLMRHILRGQSAKPTGGWCLRETRE